MQLAIFVCVFCFTLKPGFVKVFHNLTICFYSSTLQVLNALVAQRIEQIRPKDEIGVQFPSRARNDGSDPTGHHP